MLLQMLSQPARCLVLPPPQPAIDIAERGFAAHPYLVASLSGPNTTAALLAWPGVRDAFFVHQGGKVRWWCSCWGWSARFALLPAAAAGWLAGCRQAPCSLPD